MPAEVAGPVDDVVVELVARRRRHDQLDAASARPRTRATRRRCCRRRRRRADGPRGHRSSSCEGEEIGERLARMRAVGQQVDDRYVDDARPSARARRGRTRAPRSPRSSPRGCARRLRPARGRRSRPPRAGCRSGARRGRRPPSRSRRGCGSTASRTAAPRPDRRAASGPAPGSPFQHAARGRGSSPTAPGRGRRPRGSRLTSIAATASTTSRIATAASISSSVTSNDGANRIAVGVTAFTTRPAVRHAPATCLASMPSARARRRAAGPRRERRRRPGPRAGRREPVTGARGARRDVLGAITSSTARAARAASGWPPNVVAWSPGWNAAATSARAQHAPIGMPLPSAFAIVTMSGRTPSACSKPNHRPVRPRPVCTSSTIRSASRSSHSARTASR